MQKVKEKRIQEGYFEDITGTNKSIANSIMTNINKSAFNLIDFDFIGEKYIHQRKIKIVYIDFHTLKWMKLYHII